LFGMAFEQRDLGARRIVFRQFADALEEFGAAPVVEEFRRQGFRHVAETVMDRGGKGLAGIGCGLLRRLAAPLQGYWCHATPYASSARRMPENCQRAAGGKKLR